MTQLKKTVGAIALGGFLGTQVNCVPTHNQINGTLNSGLMDGIQLAITLGIYAIAAELFPAVPTRDTTTSTDTTTTDTTTM
jgi:hypothetical protein